MDSDSANRLSLLGQHYTLTLSQSMQTLTSKLGSESANDLHGDFIDRFHSLIQARVDPPLESIWAYASLSLQNRSLTKSEPTDRISLAKELFDFVSACSSACGSAKSVALLAPVVYEIHEALAKGDLNSKSEKKTVRKVRSLVEAILGHVNVCCFRGFSEEDDLGSVSGFSELVRLWAGSGISVKSFFPLVSGDVIAKLGDEECEVAYLAGCVTLELFLLKLCLSLRTGSSKPDLENELRIWAVGSVTGLDNFYFFETLVTMLLEKTLPLEHLQLSSKDQVLIRKVLFDAVILADYSFLNPERTAYLPSDRVRKLAMARLIVAHDGVSFSWEHGDRKKSISYTNAFSNSSLALQIMKWINHIIHVDKNDSLARSSSPTALIKWLVKLESKGIRVFDNINVRKRAELIQKTSMEEFKKSKSELEDMKVDEDLFYVDSKGEEVNAEDEDYEGEKVNDAVNAAFLTAAQSMKSADEKTKKRKKPKSSVKKGIKFLKY